MITVVCWKWKQAGNGRSFESHHVNVLRAMVKRNLNQEHRFVCVTDDPAGLNPKIEAHPLPLTGFEHLISPCQSKQEKKYGPNYRRRLGSTPPPFPSCYRRLWMFSQAARELGDLFLCLDIDCVIGGALDPLINPKVDFVGWCDEAADFRKIAGGIYQLRAGMLEHVWSQFDPDRSPQEAALAGFRGSDQAWMSYRLYPPPGRWARGDGLLKINWATRNSAWPTGARVIFTAGHRPPWNEEVRRKYPWISRHWQL